MKIYTREELCIINSISYSHLKRIIWFLEILPYSKQGHKFLYTEYQNELISDFKIYNKYIEIIPSKLNFLTLEQL